MTKDKVKKLLEKKNNKTKPITYFTFLFIPQKSRAFSLYCKLIRHFYPVRTEKISFLGAIKKKSVHGRNHKEKLHGRNDKDKKTGKKQEVYSGKFEPL